MSAEREFIGDGVAPSFQIERRRGRTALQVVRDAIVLSNRRADDHIPARDVPHKIFEPRPEPPLETLVRDMPNFSVGRTSR